LLNIGERIKEERVRLGLNQGDFAVMAKVSKTTQFNYEKGERSPDAEYLAAVADAGVDVLYIVTGNRQLSAANSLTEEEGAVLAHFRVLPEADRAAMARMAAAMAEMGGRYTSKT
jgi:transcriptional regulator with XRE-family HTH domain